MSRPTKSKPLTDRRMWKQLLAKTHPDSGGSHEAVLFAQALQEHVLAGGGSVGGQNGQARPQPPPQPERPWPPQPRRGGSPDAVPFDPSYNFDALTENALLGASTVPEPYASLLRLLSDCESVGFGSLCDQQNRGATYKQLAAIGHRVGMSKQERVRWYRIAESVPLSCRHAGHILSRLKRRAA